MSDPVPGTPVTFHYADSDLPGQIAVTHDSWTSAVGTNSGIGQPSAGVPLVVFFKLASGPNTATTWVAASEGTGTGDYSLIVEEIDI